MCTRSGVNTADTENEIVSLPLVYCDIMGMEVHDIMAKLYEFQQEGFLCDTTLLSVEGEAIKAHAVVLSATSPGFVQMLNRMQEEPEQVSHFSVQTSLDMDAMSGLIQKAYCHFENVNPKETCSVKSNNNVIVRGLHMLNSENYDIIRPYDSAEEIGCALELTMDTTSDVQSDQPGNDMSAPEDIIHHPENPCDRNSETINDSGNNITLAYYATREPNPSIIQTEHNTDLTGFNGGSTSEQHINYNFTSADVTLDDEHVLSVVPVESMNCHTDDDGLRDSPLYEKYDVIDTTFHGECVRRDDTTEEQCNIVDKSYLHVDGRSPGYKQESQMVVFDSTAQESSLSVVGTTCTSVEREISKIIIPSNPSTIHEEAETIFTNGIFEKKFSCAQCDRKFSRAHDVQTHLRVHTGDKPYMCGWCAKSFAQIGNLRKHERIHSGEKPYNCDLCTKKFTELSGLRSHVTLVHRREKSHVCDICGKGFSLKSSLKKHGLTHTRQKSLKCNMRQLAFLSNKKLKNHQESPAGISCKISIVKHDTH